MKQTTLFAKTMKRAFLCIAGGLVAAILSIPVPPIAFLALAFTGGTVLMTIFILLRPTTWRRRDFDLIKIGLPDSFTYRVGWDAGVVAVDPSNRKVAIYGQDMLGEIFEAHEILGYQTSSRSRTTTGSSVIFVGDAPVVRHHNSTQTWRCVDFTTSRVEIPRLRVWYGKFEYEMGEMLARLDLVCGLR
jgi:hypothetical protein